MQEHFYLDKLYPLQDSVLRSMEILSTDFYLTGGTAISRAYFHHRYSDDLDFFVNASQTFSNQIDAIVNHLKSQFFDIKSGAKSESFHRLFITKDEVVLKIDFVNDVPFRKGEPQPTSIFERTDNVINILSNKISALSRDEPKDLSDILLIARNTKFDWREIIEDAKNKDLDVEEVERAKMIDEFVIERLSQVNWCSQINIVEAERHVKIIAKDILLGRNNSLCL